MPRSLAIRIVALAPFVTAAWGQTTFGGYYCEGDCSGQAAGYDWAEEHNELSGCPGGKSMSFQEGCQAYSDNPLRGSDQDDQGNDIIK